MKAYLLLVLLLAGALGKGYTRGNSIVLHKGVKNVLSFACGGTDKAGGARIVNTDYSYTFKGQPKWLSQQGSTLIGNAPADFSGSWPITVTYNSLAGKKVGDLSFYLTTSEESSKIPQSKNLVYYTSGAIKGSELAESDIGRYVVLLPFLAEANTATTNGTTNSKTSQVDSKITVAAVNCDRYQAFLTASQSNKTAAEAQLNAVTERLAALDDKIADLKAKEAQIKQTAGSSSPTEAIDKEISQLKTTLQQQEAQLTNDTHAVDSAERDVGKAQDFLEIAQTNKQGVAQKKSEADEYKQRIDEAKKALDTVQTQATAAKAKTTAAQSVVDKASVDAATANQTLDAASAKVKKIKAELDQAIKEESDLREKGRTVRTALNDAKYALSTAKGDEEYAQRRVDRAKKSYDYAVATLGSADITAQIAKADQDVTNAQTQLANANAALTKANSKLSATQISYKETKAKLAALCAKRHSALIQAGGTRQLLADIYENLSEAQTTRLDLSIHQGYSKSHLKQATQAVAASTLRLDTCKQGGLVDDYVSGAIVVDSTCGLAQATSALRGAGKVKYAGPDYIMVNGMKIYLGKCSERRYRKGRSQFDLQDNVEYEIVQTGRKVWGKKVTCKE